MRMFIRPLAFALLLASTPAGAQTLAESLERLAAAGNAEAAYHLGMMHQVGLEGVKKDELKAFELYQKSAEGGDPLGEYKLGAWHEGQISGLAAPDKELALRHKMVAAKAGYSVAQHDVAKLLYEQGDIDEALRWLEVSARQGYRPSLEALASLYSGEAKVPKDAGKNYAYFLILNGGSVEKAPARAKEWAAKAIAEMNAADKAEAEDIVAGWKIAPTPLTLQAMAGPQAARQLVEQTPAPEAPAQPAADAPIEEVVAEASPPPAEDDLGITDLPGDDDVLSARTSPEPETPPAPPKPTYGPK